jgi:hypothetical protein
MVDFSGPWWLLVDVSDRDPRHSHNLWRHLVTQAAQRVGGAKARGRDQRAIHQARFSSVAVLSVMRRFLVTPHRGAARPALVA